MNTLTRAEKKARKNKWMVDTYGEVWKSAGWLKPETVYSKGPTDMNDKEQARWFLQNKRIARELMEPEFEAMTYDKRLRASRVAVLWDLHYNSLNTSQFARILRTLEPNRDVRHAGKKYSSMIDARQDTRDEDILKRYDPKQVKIQVDIYSPRFDISQRFCSFGYRPRNLRAKSVA